MTFATLRALHAVIGDALDDIENAFRDASAAADPYDALRSPISPSPSPLSPYSPDAYLPLSATPCSPYPHSPYPSPSLPSPRDLRIDSRAPSPTPSFGTSSLSSYSGTGTCSSRASSRFGLSNDRDAPPPKDIAIHGASSRMNDADRQSTAMAATDTPPTSSVALLAANTVSAAHLPTPALPLLSSTPARASRKRSNTVTSASNAFRRVSNLLGVTSKHNNNSSHSIPMHLSPANKSPNIVPVIPPLDAAVTPTSTPARAVLRPCGGSSLESPSAEDTMSPIAFAPPTSPPYVNAATPMRKRTGSITASMSALTRACTTAASLAESPVTPGEGWRRSVARGSPAREKKDSPSPIRFAPNPNVPSTILSPQTPTSVRCSNSHLEYAGTDSPRTPTSAAKERERKRPTPLPLLPALTPTKARPHDGEAEREQSQLPTPASLFSEGSPSLSLMGAHTPGRGTRSGGAGLISSSEVSLSAVGNTPRTAASQSVPALGAAWEEPASAVYGMHATARKMSVASVSVPTPPPSGRAPGGRRMEFQELDWPSLDEAYYAVEQDGQRQAARQGKGDADASSGSPHTPGGPRSRTTPPVSARPGQDAGERARRETAERLAASPVVLAAVSKLVAACGQMCASVQRPFLTVCDAAMGYHLPACLRLLEAAHIPEILREAGPSGMHVQDIARTVGEIRRAGKMMSADPTRGQAEESRASWENEDRRASEEPRVSGEGQERADTVEEEYLGVDPALLSHALRLLATHHITKEVRPDVFANNRLSSAMDSGRSLTELMNAPDTKYDGTNGIAAFVGLCTDELFKSAAYLADCYLPSAEGVSKRNTRQPSQDDKWYQTQSDESGAREPDPSKPKTTQDNSGHTSLADLALGTPNDSTAASPESCGTEDPPSNTRQLRFAYPQAEPPQRERSRQVAFSKRLMHAPFNLAFRTDAPYFEWLENKDNASRLKRFGRAMTGTSAWEVPGAIVGGFPWHSLPQGALVVDVGGGIGSTSLLLAHAFPHLRFLVQDRPQVVTMGEAAWRDRSPQFLETGRAAFQAHDFFTPQPVWPSALPESAVSKDVPAVFLLRVITHDWPDLYVTRILMHLRRAAGPDTKLLLADWVLPLACIDEDPVPESPREAALIMQEKMKTPPLPGAIRTLAPEGSPLLPNLGKANANAYWLDLTMRVTFNAQERTLRELASLTLTAGWRVVQVSTVEGSLFGHIIAVPTDIPSENLALLDEPLPGQTPAADAKDGAATTSELKRPAMGDTFCSAVALPSEDDVRKGVRAGRKAAQSWQKRATEWRQRLVRKSSAMWRDRKNSVVQQPQPPVPLMPRLELLPAVEVGMSAHGRAGVVATGPREGRQSISGSVASSVRTDIQKGNDDEDKDKRRTVGLRKVFSRAQLGARGT